MSIIKHKWRAQWDCTCIEKFYYTRDGHHCGITDRRSPDFKPEFEWHEGRVMLNRGREGHFFVDWSTGGSSLKNSSLAELRRALVDYLDGIRTKSDVSDMETWETVIHWPSYAGGAPTARKARIKSDEAGRVIRYAAWNEQRKEFIVEQVPYNVNVSIEPFTPARWKEIGLDSIVRKKHQTAEHAFENALRSFSPTLHEPVLMDVLKAMTRTFDKHRKVLEVRLELQRKEKGKKETTP